MYVGRAPVANEQEMSNFVRKTLAYEDFTPVDKYLAYMVGEYLGFGGPAEYATASMEEIRLGSDNHGHTTAGFAADNRFQTSTLYDSPTFTWSKTELINIINSGVHVLNHLGHADYTYDMKLDTSDLTSLTNTQYFFAYSQGCNAGGFDTSNCFAEVVTTMENGVAAVVMNARYGWGTYNSTDGPSQWFNRQFWDAAFGENIYEFGKMNSDSKEDTIPIRYNEPCWRWCYYELNLFGDPELSVVKPSLLAPTLLTPAHNVKLNDNTPTFKWDNVYQADNYELWIDNDVSFASPVVHENTIENTFTIAAPGLSDGIYYWRLRAYKGARTSFFSPTRSFQVDKLMPQPLTPGDGINTNDNTPTFGWENAVVADNWELWVDDDSGFGSPAVKENTTDNYHEVTVQLTDGVYYWRVRGYRDESVSVFSLIRSFRVDTLAPSAPFLISPADGANTNDNTPALHWGTVIENSTPVVYKVYISDNSEFPGGFSDDFEDGDISGWTTGGDNTWVATTEAAHGGSRSAYSGDIGDSQTSWIKRDVAGPGTLSFWWKVDSETNSDFLRFYIDGSEKASISGSVDWNQQTFSISLGTHEIKWEYTKDGSVTVGADKGWIDDAELEMLPSSETTADTWTVTPQLPDGVWYWRVQAQDNAGNVGENSATRSFRVDTVSPMKSILLDNFDDGNASGWTLSGFWHVRSRRSYSSPYSLAFNKDSDNTYENSGHPSSGNAITSLISLPSGSVTLSFMSWYETESGAVWDKKLVYVSTDGGNTWEQVYQIAASPMREWRREEVNFSSYAGENIQIKFRFDTVDNLFNDYEGWYIDDIEIKTTTPELVSPADGESTTDKTPVLKWEPLDDISLPVLYRVVVDSDNEFSSIDRDSGWISTPEWEISPQLPDGTWYYWRVQARDNAGNFSENSVACSFYIIDTTPPVISGVGASGITQTSATITWATNEPSDSLVEYGTTIGYGSTSYNATLVTSHSINLTGLSSDTIYHYRAKSTDISGNTATSLDYIFTTSSPPPPPPPPPSSPPSPPPNNPPTASFTFSPSSPTINDIVQFTDESTDSDGTIVSWSWNFGDGTTSTLLNPTHQYSSAGTYTVTLTITDDNGATDDYSQIITVSAQEVPKTPTSISISPSNFTLQSGQITTLTATLRDDANNPLTNKTISWSRTAGNLSVASSTTNSYGQVSVTYTAPFVSVQTSVTITASFAGDNKYLASSTTSVGTVLPQEVMNVLENLKRNLATQTTELEIPVENEQLWALENAFVKGTLGACITVRVELGAQVEFQHQDLVVDIRVSLGEKVEVTVSSEVENGKTIMLNIDNQTIPVPEPGEIRVLYDNVEVGLADDYSDVLNPTNENVPEYLILLGEKGAQVLVSIPQFSVHTITITAQIPKEGAPPTNWLLIGVVIGVAIGVGLTLLVIKRKRVPPEEKWEWKPAPPAPEEKDWYRLSTGGTSP